MPDAPASGEAALVVHEGVTLRVSSPNAEAAFVALAAKVSAELSALKNAISGAAVVPSDGGAPFKAALLASLADWPGDAGSPVLKAES